MSVFVDDVPTSSSSSVKKRECLASSSWAKTSPLWQSIRREDAPYCSNFCEENVMELAKILLSAIKSERDEGQDGVPVSSKVHLFCIFISNDDKHTIMWKQRLGQRENDGLIGWDYHVILCVRSENGENDEIIDYDTTLPYHCQLKRYINESFRPDYPLVEKYRQ